MVPAPEWILRLWEARAPSPYLSARGQGRGRARGGVPATELLAPLHLISTLLPAHVLMARAWNAGELLRLQLEHRSRLMVRAWKVVGRCFECQ